MKELLIYGDIGWDNTAKAVAEKLQEFDGADAIIRINSGGGDVYEGIAILNTLKSYSGTLTVVVESLAASAASFIAAGVGGRVVIRPNAEIMIHKAWTMQVGNSDDLSKTIADLDRQDIKLAKIYAERAGGTVEDWLDLMKLETWYSADEAVAAGLADAVEDARQLVDASAAASPKVFAQFKYGGRASAPPPKLMGGRSASAPESTNKPSDGQEGENAMSFLNKLAQATGMTPEEVKAELSGFFNEQTAEVPAVITVSYPDEATVVPTGRTTVEPTTEVPEGLTFAVTGTTEGWTAEVNETTGVVTVVSADGSRIGDTGEITLSVTGSGGASEFTLKVSVISADQKSEEDNVGDPADPVLDPATPMDPGPDNVVVPRAYYEELTQAYAVNGERMAELAKRDREQEVDEWIARGKFSAGLRAKALSALEKDPDAARRVWGGLPDGKIPRGEKGYSKAEVKDSGDPLTKEEKIAAQMARANELAKSK